MVSDIAYLKQFGSNAYRFSVSWPRILPNCGGAVNPAGIAFYRRMIDEIIANGAEPYFTMFHWDLPQACQDQFGGFGDERIIEAFVEYAKVLLENFGDKITYWLTINEPEANCKFGWEQGIFAPGQRLGTQIGRFNCLKWSHIIHGRIVQYARQNYPNSGWKFGVPSIVSWFQPATSSPEDVAAADFVQQRDLGWFYDPTVFGDWGEAAKTDPNEGNFVRNAAFTPAEQAIIRNTTDLLR
ncbi:glycoside hydrolase superfamily [Chytridium lagenaria]|nr:glycoside hydrolase superfamily [Chytridium lagenaria]